MIKIQKVRKHKHQAYNQANTKHGTQKMNRKKTRKKLWEWYKQITFIHYKKKISFVKKTKTRSHQKNIYKCLCTRGSPDIIVFKKNAAKYLDKNCKNKTGQI